MKLNSQIEKIRQYLYRTGPVSVCLALAACTTAPSVVSTEGAQQQLTEIQAELKALRAEVNQLRLSFNPKPGEPPVAGAAAVTSVRFDQSPVLGNRNQAKVALMEFSDYQCPYCGRFHSETFNQIKQRYIDTGKLLYVYRNFPLSFHPEAKPAALAALCGGNQGAYWPMQQRLYANQARLGGAYYEELAKELKLNTLKFQACLKDPKTAKAIEDDFTYGQQLGVQGTPHFFIGKVQGNQLVEVKSVSGAQPFMAFAQVIDAFLK